MPDRRLLQFGKSLQTVESVLGHPASADQRRVQLGNPLPARYRSGTGTWHCRRRRQDRIHRRHSAWYPGPDKPDPRVHCRRIKIRYHFFVSAAISCASIYTSDIPMIATAPTAYIKVITRQIFIKLFFTPAVVYDSRVKIPLNTMNAA